MYRQVGVIVISVLCVLLVTSVEAERGGKVPTKEETAIVVIALKGLKVTDDTLKVSYQIENVSEQDVWLCEDVDAKDEWDFEAYLSDEQQTLTIRKRLDVWADLESYDQ